MPDTNPSHAYYVTSQNRCTTLSSYCGVGSGEWTFWSGSWYFVCDSDRRRMIQIVTWDQGGRADIKAIDVGGKETTGDLYFNPVPCGRFANLLTSSKKKH